jgi:hypothetical protein
VVIELDIDIPECHAVTLVTFTSRRGAVSTIPSVQLASHDQYTDNHARLEQPQEVLNNWKRTNEQGRDQWVRLQNEVMQIIEAGEQALFQLPSFGSGY